MANLGLAEERTGLLVAGHRDSLESTRCFLQRNSNDVGALQGDHGSPGTVFDRGNGIEAEARGQNPIECGGRSTALDVANAALYLASDEAAFISGVCIEVDGARCV